MKIQKPLNIIVTTLITVVLTQINAQVSSTTNAGLSTDYVGWNAAQAFPLQIRHNATSQPVVRNL